MWDKQLNKRVFDEKVKKKKGGGSVPPPLVRRRSEWTDAPAFKVDARGLASLTTQPPRHRRSCAALRSSPGRSRPVQPAGARKPTASPNRPLLGHKPRNWEEAELTSRRLMGISHQRKNLVASILRRFGSLRRKSDPPRQMLGALADRPVSCRILTELHLRFRRAFVWLVGFATTITLGLGALLATGTPLSIVESRA